MNTTSSPDIVQTKKFDADTDANANGISTKNNMSASPEVCVWGGRGGGGGGGEWWT